MDGEGTTTNGAAEMTSPVPSKKSTPVWAYVVAVVVVVAIVLGVLFALEQQGKITTGLFGASSETVATVNGVPIKSEDLTTSMNQISATAQLQGADITNPEIQATIRTQAVDMLVNTELLKQEAADRGITVDDAAVQARIDQLIIEVGSEEMLNERMATLGISDSILRRDIKIELMIQELLDQEFAEADLSVSEEEVLGVYEGAGGAAAGLPALDEVREQVEAQVRANKEQVIVDEFITSLRANARIELR